MGPDRESTVVNALRERRVRPKKALAGFFSTAIRMLGSFLACRNVLLSGALLMGEGRKTHGFFLARACRNTARRNGLALRGFRGQSQKAYKKHCMIFTYRRFLM